MEGPFKLPASPGTPLHQIPPERVNQQRHSPSKDSLNGSRGHSRDSSVHEKVAAFNTLAMQSKQLERKVNDAALKRAELGREEAECEMRRWRYEAEELRKQLEESQRRERKVSERAEHYMEKLASAKEKYNNIIPQKDHEIKVRRKEAWRVSAELVKIKEQLQSSKAMMKTSQVELANEKERSAQREQEAFAARYGLVGVQEELAQSQQQVKLVEQERDALRTIAKNEEIARIAAEGRLPLPVSPEDDEFASPKKSRKSMDLITITTSAATEEELDYLNMLLLWHRHQANRAHEQIDFLETERCMRAEEPKVAVTSSEDVKLPPSPKIKTEPSDLFDIPPQAVFRPASPVPEESPWISPEKKTLTINTIITKPSYQQQDPPFYARTPSCEPPAPAMLNETNTSLLSLLDVPQSPIPEEEDSSTESQASPSSQPDVEADKTITTSTFHTISTTTRIPLANPPDLTPAKTLITTNNNQINEALSPTVSREEALAMIRERRGRARSLAQGTLTPRKQMVDNGTRRDISAPAIRSAGVRGRSQARV